MTDLLNVAALAVSLFLHSRFFESASNSPSEFFEVHTDAPEGLCKREQFLSLLFSYPFAS